MRTQLNSIMLDVVNFGVCGRSEIVGINFLPFVILLVSACVNLHVSVKNNTFSATLLGIVVEIGLIYWMIAPVL